MQAATANSSRGWWKRANYSVIAWLKDFGFMLLLFAGAITLMCIVGFITTPLSINVVLTDGLGVFIVGGVPSSAFIAVLRRFGL